MNPLWFLVAYQLGKSSSNCSDRDDTYSGGSLSTSSLDNTVAFFWALLVGWLAFPATMLFAFDFPNDTTVPPFLQALVMLAPIFICPLALLAYFYFNLTNCSSEKILAGWLLGALVLGGLWYLCHIEYLNVNDLTLAMRLTLAAFPPALMVATNVISHKLSIWLKRKN